MYLLDFQKRTCFNQQNPQNEQPTTQQPRPSNISHSSSSNSNLNSPQTTNSQTPINGHQQCSSNFSARETSNIPIPTSSRINDQPSLQQENLSHKNHNDDCSCSDDEMSEITEKRQSIFDANPGPSGCSNHQMKSKSMESSSSDSSSFEEVGASIVKINDEKWEVIEKTASNGVGVIETPLLINDIVTSQNASPSQSSSGNIGMMRSLKQDSIRPEVIKVTRRRSDSSLISLNKSNTINIDTSLFDPLQSGSEVKKLKISCKKCGKAKSNIKREILKLSEQLKSSKKSEVEINAKIKEFLDYLESKSQPSEMTETEDSQTNENEEGARFLPTSSSQDEIEENILDENEGINVYPTTEEFDSMTSQASSDNTRRFMSLDDIQSR